VLPPDLECVRGWDLAASEATVIKSDPDWTATVKIGFSPSQMKWYILDAQRWRENPSEVERLIKFVADEDALTGSVKAALPQDPGQAGKSQARSLVRRLAGHAVKAEPVTGDKVTRAMSLASQASGGNVVVLEADWNDDFIAEITGLVEFYARQLSEYKHAELARMER
jgi:predicted phage terminase large subunit-like protein